MDAVRRTDKRVLPGSRADSLEVRARSDVVLTAGHRIKALPVTDVRTARVPPATPAGRFEQAKFATGGERQ
jgi:hypothetical protein